MKSQQELETWCSNPRNWVEYTKHHPAEPRHGMVEVTIIYRRTLAQLTAVELALLKATYMLHANDLLQPGEFGSVLQSLAMRRGASFTLNSTDKGDAEICLEADLRVFDDRPLLMGSIAMHYTNAQIAFSKLPAGSLKEYIQH